MKHLELIHELLKLPANFIEKAMEGDFSQMRLFEIDHFIKTFSSFREELTRDEKAKMDTEVIEGLDAEVNKKLKNDAEETQRKLDIISVQIKLYREKIAEEQSKKFKKELPPYLEKFMIQYFPEANSLHEHVIIRGKNFDHYSPMLLALRKKDRQAVIELLSMDSIRSFSSERLVHSENLEHRINAFDPNYLPESFEFEDFKWWIETLYQRKAHDPSVNTQLKTILSELLSSKCEFPNEFTKRNIYPQCLQFLSSNPQFIDLFQPDETTDPTSPTNNVLPDTDAIFDYNLFLPLIDKYDFNALTEPEVERLKNYVLALFSYYSAIQNRIDIENKPHRSIDEIMIAEDRFVERTESRERRLESLKRLKINLAGLRQFIPKVLNKIPEKHQIILEGIITDEKFIKSAVLLNDHEMITYAMEYGDTKLTFDIIKDIINHADEKTLEILAKYHNKTIYEFSNELFEGLILGFKKFKKENFNKYFFSERSSPLFHETHLKLLSLPIDWTEERSKIFHETYYQEFNKQLNKEGKLEKLDRALKSIEHDYRQRREHRTELKPSILAEIDLKSRQDIAITDKIFGHILNDHALAGTTLQGSTLHDSFKVINKFIKQVNEGSRKIQGLDPSQEKYTLENLNFIKENFDKNLEFMEILDKVANFIVQDKQAKLRYSPEKVINDISDFIFEKIKNSNHVLLPGGWIGLNNTNGHAMLYELVKTEKGFVLLIHNTGAGIDRHQRYFSEKGTYYSSVKAYSIPTDNLADIEDDLKLLLKTLIKPQIEPSFGLKSFDADKIYGDIEDIADKMGMREISPDPFNHEWTQGQMSGTCAWQVIGSYLKNINYDKRGLQYPDIRHEIMKFGIDEYARENTHRMSSGTVQRQLHFGLQGLARNVRALSERIPILSNARRNDALLLIKNTEQALKKSSLAANSALNSTVKDQKTQKFPQYVTDEHLETSHLEKTHLEGARKRTLEYTLQSENPQYKTTFSETDNRDLTSDRISQSSLPDYTVIQFDPKEPLKSLQDAYKICNDNYKAHHYGAVERMLEQFYLNMPLGSPLWETLPPEDLRRSIEILCSLNGFLVRSLAAKTNIPLPEQNIALFTGNMLAIDVAKQLFKDNPAALNQLLLKCYFENRGFSSLIKSPYFVTADPKLNQRANELSAALSEISIAAQKGDHAKSIVEFIIKNSASKDKLLSACLEADFDSHIPDTDIRLISYYLRQRDYIKDNYQDIELNIASAFQIYQMSTEMGLSLKGKNDAVLKVSPEMDVMRMSIALPMDRATPKTNEVTGVWEFNELNNGENFSKEYESRLLGELSVSQAPIIDPNLKAALEGDRLDSNQIQVLTNESVLTAEAAFKRSVLNTRVDEATQITSTLDLIKKEYYRLPEISFQNFIFLNIFQGNVLDKQLIETPKVATELIHLIKQGLKNFNQDGKLKQPALFFLKTAVFLENVLQQLPKNIFNDIHEKALKELETIGLSLESSIQYYETLLSKQQDLQSTNLLKELHGLNLIRLHHKSVVSPPLSPKDYEDILTAISFRKNCPHSDLEDPYIARKATEAIDDLSPILNQTLENLQLEKKEDFQNLMNQFIKRSGINLPKMEFPLHWEGHYPDYRGSISIWSGALISCNVLQGVMYQSNIRTITTPPELYNSPLFKSFFKNIPTSCRVSPDNTLYEFEIEGNTYRYILDPDEPQGIIQGLFTVQGQTKWFQYESGPANTLPIEALPNTLTEYGKEFWVSLNASDEANQQILIRDGIQEKLLCSIEQGRVKALDDAGNETLLQLVPVKNDDILFQEYPFIKKFEHDSFIELWKKIKPDGLLDEIVLKFPRYGLEFRKYKKPDGNFGDFILMPDKKYRINLSNNTVIVPNFNNPLILEEIDNPNNTMAVIPRQLFLATKKEKSEFYALEPDIQAKVLKHIISGDKMSIFKEEELNVPGTIYYSGTEQASFLKVNAKTGLSAETLDDKIYLAYLHLVNREPHLAHELLQKIMNENKPLNANQLEGLRKIMFEVPARIARDSESRKVEEDARMETAEVLTVRLLAGSIIANQKLQSNIPKELKVEGLQAQNKAINAKSLQEYQKNLSNNLAKALEDKQFSQSLLSIYLSLKRKSKKIADTLRFKPRDEHALLRYITRYQTKVVPSVIYRKKQLAYARFLEEKCRLERLKKETGDTLPKALQARLDRVNQKIESFKEIETEQSVISDELVRIIPDANIRFQFPSHRLLFQGDSSRLKADKITVQKLSAATLDLDFIYSFQDYYRLAKSPPSADRELLLKKLNQYIDGIGSKRQAGQLSHSARDNLIILLYSILLHPNDFPEPPINLESLQQIMAKLAKHCAENPAIERRVPVRKVIPIHIPIASPIVKPIEKNMTLDAGSIMILEPAFAAERKRFKEILARRQMEEHKEHKEHKEMNELITFRENDESVRQFLYREILTDYAKGTEKNSVILDRNIAAVELWETLQKESTKDAPPLPPLSAKIQQAVEKNQVELNNMQEEIIKLVQSPPSDPQERADWELKNTALDRHDPTWPELLHLFLMQDDHLYKEKTGLSQENILKLNQMIFEYLLKATYQQHHERLLNEIKKLSNPLSPDQYQAVCNQIGLLLDIERSFNPVEHPEMLLFEYLDNKIIYKEQFIYLRDFLEKDRGLFKSQAVQLIMGGGKSKVLSPLLVLKKATGTNLPIIEVPHALFQLNRADLQLITKEKFGKDAHAFFFDDTVECTPTYLINRLKEFRDIIANKEYLITTKESMQAFELKFIRMLRYLDDNDEEQVKKLKLMSDILRIFKYQGDVVIDEVDSTLDTRKQLITAAGKGTYVPEHEAVAVYDLYNFMQKTIIQVGPPYITPPRKKYIIDLQEVIAGKRACSKEEWKIIFEQLADKLVKREDSPLSSIINKILQDTKGHAEKAAIQQNLIHYLLGQATEIPKEIFELSSIEQDRIAIYKEELGTTLGLTLKRNLNENYGLPIDPSKGVLSEIAIPYAASNTPNERSKFSNYLETIGYTIQAHLNQPISKELVKTAIQHFKTLEEHELQSLGFKPKDDLKQTVSDDFRLLTGKPLEAVDIESNESVESFYTFIKNNEKFKRHCLIHHVLNQVEKSAVYLSSDAHNHASQFRTVQGMTGTNWNKRTLPPYMVPNELVSLGSDGQTINHLLRHPEPTHLLSETSNSPKQILAEALNLFTNHSNKKSLHAWIDLGAYFKGLNNITVARAFAQFFANTPEFQHQKYVLYFGQDDKLYAMPVTADPKTLTPIPLENTDPDYIQRTLGCGPDSYFTYYDQRRTTGTDIKQAIEAHALVTLGVRTLSRDYLQAVARMRELKNAQRIECVIPKDVQDAHPEITQWDVNRVVKFCIDNQVERLAEDHFRSSLQKLRNVVRNDMFERLLGERNVKQQKALMNKFHKVFFTEIRKTAFQQFGNVKTKEKTRDILYNTKDDLLNQWKTIMQEAGIELSVEESTVLSKQMTEIIEQSLPICYDEIERLKSQEEANLEDSEMTEEKVEEEEKEEEEEVEEEQEKEASIRSNVVPLKMKSLGPINFDRFSIDSNHTLGGVKIEPLNIMLKQDEAQKTVTETETIKTNSDRSISFSDNLFVSQNFLKTVESQGDLMGGYKKDGLFLMVEQDDEHKNIKFMVITPEEAASLKHSLTARQPSETHHFWIETVHQTPFAGHKPFDETLHPEYQKGLEQMAFLSGDLDVLHQHMHKNSWLATDSAKKLTFLRDVIKPVHRDKADLFQPLVQKAEEEFGMKNLLTQFQRKKNMTEREEQPRQDSGGIDLG